MFAPSPADGALCQGEILSDVPQMHVWVDSLGKGVEEVDFEKSMHPYAVILTQDCDLGFDYRTRFDASIDPGKREIKYVPNILLCELFPEEKLRPRIKESAMWRRVIQNQDSRYHAFDSVPHQIDKVGDGVPTLVADFKQVFCIRTDELYKRLSMGVRRRAVLRVPFVQDLGNRFGYFCSRIAVPTHEELAAGLLPAGIDPSTLLPARVSEQPQNLMGRFFSKFRRSND